MQWIMQIHIEITTKYGINLYHPYFRFQTRDIQNIVVIVSVISPTYDESLSSLLNRNKHYMTLFIRRKLILL